MTIKVDVSIIIVNYNTKELTINCIKSVYASKTKYSFEIILVDNASSDSSVEETRNSFPDVSIIVNKENIGFGRANNQAAEVSTGRYLYILNSDTEIEDNVIEKVITYGDTHTQAGIIGTKVIFADGKLQQSYYKFPTLSSEFIFFTIGVIKSKNWFLFNFNKYEGNPLNGPYEVDVISGCSMFIRRQIYGEIGLFDENYFMYYEDSEFCHRAKSSGYKCIYFPMTVVKHIHKGSAKNNENDFQLLLSCFKGACLYFTSVKGRAYTSIFKTICFSMWFIEMVILIFFTIFRKHDKITKKINMLRCLLKG